MKFFLSTIVFAGSLATGHGHGKKGKKITDHKRNGKKTTVPKRNDKKITGPKQNFANVGFLQTYMVVNTRDDSIMELGVELDKDLMEVDLMPEEESDGKNDIIDPDSKEIVWRCCGHEADVEWPVTKKYKHPFDHFVANYNPIGHGGPPAYRAPHWDFHFYTMTRKERLSVESPQFKDACPIFEEFGVFIPMTCPDFYYQNEPIPCDEKPPAHELATAPFSEGLGLAVEPHMGNHMIDVTSPEVDPERGDFSHTWIFGIQGGHLVLWESMITSEYMKSLYTKSMEMGDLGKDPNGGVISRTSYGVEVVVPINLPPAAPVAGLYPSSYKMAYDKRSETYRVSMTDMVKLPASTGVCD